MRGGGAGRGPVGGEECADPPEAACASRLAETMVSGYPAASTVSAREVLAEPGAEWAASAISPIASPRVLMGRTSPAIYGSFGVGSYGFSTPPLLARRLRLPHLGLQLRNARPLSTRCTNTTLRPTSPSSTPASRNRRPEPPVEPVIRNYDRNGPRNPVRCRRYRTIERVPHLPHRHQRPADPRCRVLTVWKAVHSTSSPCSTKPNRCRSTPSTALSPTRLNRERTRRLPSSANRAASRRCNKCVSINSAYTCF